MRIDLTAVRSTVTLGGESFAFHTIAGSRAHGLWLDAVANGSWERDVFAFLGQAVRPGDICLDVGGWIGPHALFLARRVGGAGKVFSFEPDPVAREFLSINAKHNGLDNVVVLPSAVGSAVSQASLRSGEHWGDSCTQLAVEETGEGLIVETTTLDDFARDAGIKPDVIKIDVEGAEDDVIRGGLETLRAAKVIFLEVHLTFLRQRGVAGEQLVPALAKALGLEPVALTSNNAETLHVGFLAADRQGRE